MKCVGFNRSVTHSAALALALTAACASDEVDTWLDTQSCTGTATPASWLSETGCFTGEALTPVDTLLSYEIHAPLWSDGAEKRRYLTLPKDALLELDAAGNLLLPPGGVLIKEFALAGRRVETRFLSRDLEGQWHFATYAWEEDGMDARLMEDGAELVVGEETWAVPSLRECETCHTDSAALSIGVVVAQLDLSAPHPFTGAETNQLETLVDVRWVSAMDAAIIAVNDVPALISPSSEASLEERARSYLHSNCAFCHNGSGAAGLDLRYDIPLADTGVCNARPEFGDFFVEGARLLVPGDPEMSLVLLRMRTELSSWRMPTVGTAQVDPVGVELVGEWISQRTDCL